MYEITILCVCFFLHFYHFYTHSPINNFYTWYINTALCAVSNQCINSLAMRDKFETKFNCMQMIRAWLWLSLGLTFCGWNYVIFSFFFFKFNMSNISKTNGFSLSFLLFQTNIMEMIIWIITSFSSRFITEIVIVYSIFFFEKKCIPFVVFRFCCCVLLSVFDFIVVVVRFRTINQFGTVSNVNSEKPSHKIWIFHGYYNNNNNNRKEIYELEMFHWVEWFPINNTGQAFRGVANFMQIFFCAWATSYFGMEMERGRQSGTEKQTNRFTYRYVVKWNVLRRFFKYLLSLKFIPLFSVWMTTTCR